MDQKGSRYGEDMLKMEHRPWRGQTSGNCIGIMENKMETIGIIGII